ncbi:hypothetical protein [Neobacillus sp. SAB-20_R2A]|uniref:hypothetical protein n=1 Tax=Neobacillus sp. SAB-20_R2A TaxID=3120519 RepID=UPI003C6DDCC4
MKLMITEIIYSTADETYYVTQRRSKYFSIYNSESVEETRKLLTRDGWNYAGKLEKWDFSLFDTWERENELIALWEEKLNSRYYE